MRQAEFELMTSQQVRMHTRGEGAVQRGKPLYYERPWQQVLDEMTDAGARTVGELNAARVRTLYETVFGL